jgi:hypothetical protein
MGTTRDNLESYVQEGVYRYNNGTGKKLVKAFYIDLAGAYDFSN